MAMTLEQEFEHFVERVYGGDPPHRSSPQWKQLRDAFYGGCLIAYTSSEDFTLDLNYRYKELKAGL